MHRLETQIARARHTTSREGACEAEKLVGSPVAEIEIDVLGEVLAECPEYGIPRVFPEGTHICHGEIRDARSAAVDEKELRQRRSIVAMDPCPRGAGFPGNDEHGAIRPYASEAVEKVALLSALSISAVSKNTVRVPAASTENTFGMEVPDGVSRYMMFPLAGLNARFCWPEKPRAAPAGSRIRFLNCAPEKLGLSGMGFTVRSTFREVTLPSGSVTTRRYSPAFAAVRRLMKGSLRWRPVSDRSL